MHCFVQQGAPPLLPTSIDRTRLTEDSVLCEPNSKWYSMVATVILVGLTCSATVSAQNNSLLAPQAESAKQAPVTLTLKDALALAEKNDPTVLAAASDALVAHEDTRQARAAL